MLDRSGTRFFFEEHGVAFSIQFAHVDSGLLYDLIVPPCWRKLDKQSLTEFEFVIEHADCEGVRAYRLLIGGEMVMGSSRLDQFVAPAAKRVHWEVAQASRLEYFIHAGVVAVDGRAVLLPGRTFSGKSTLVKELVGLGMTYYSDEYALVTPSPVPMIRPFPRQISLRPDMLEGEPFPVIDSSGPPPEIPLDSVYFLNFEPEAEWRTERISPGRAALKLFENSLVAQTRPAELMQALGQLCRPVPSFQGVRGEGSLAAQVLVSEVLERRSTSEMLSPL